MSKTIEKLDDTVFSDDYTNTDTDTDFDIVTFFTNDVGLNSIKLKNANLGDDNFGNSDPKTNNHVRLMASLNKYKQLKACKKDI